MPDVRGRRAGLPGFEMTHWPACSRRPRCRRPLATSSPRRARGGEGEGVARAPEPDPRRSRSAARRRSFAAFIADSRNGEPVIARAKSSRIERRRMPDPVSGFCPTSCSCTIQPRRWWCRCGGSPRVQSCRRRSGSATVGDAKAAGFACTGVWPKRREAGRWPRRRRTRQACSSADRCCRERPFSA